MKHQMKYDDKKRYELQGKKIEKTCDVLTELERKMYSHFGKKTNEDYLLSSHDDQYQSKPQQQTKGKSTFKLFPKSNAQPMNIDELQKETPSKATLKQPVSKAKTQMGQLIEEVEAIQILVRKKLALKQQRVAQLQRQLSMQTEEKVHLYRLNCQLELQLEDIIKNKLSEQERHLHEQKMLEEELKRLNKIYEEKKSEGKKLKRQQELLRETLKNSHHHRKGCLESQIRCKSKQKIIRKEDKQEEQYLRGLVVELDRLKNMVRQKMRKQKSKMKLK